jgi:hypothetical protein
METGKDVPKPTMQDLVDEVWHSKKGVSFSLDQDAYGMALQGLHKDCSK